MVASAPKWLYDVFKIGLTAGIIFAVSETAKRSTIFAALIAALPLTSLLAILWLRFEGSEVTRIADLTSGIFWMVLPGLVFFLVLPALLRRAWSFWLSLGLAVAATVIAYYAFFRALKWAGVQV